MNCSMPPIARANTLKMVLNQPSLNSTITTVNGANGTKERNVPRLQGTNPLQFDAFVRQIEDVTAAVNRNKDLV